ncbi:hypothetical protein RUND412_006179 [Rhizina undulata]
MQSSLSIPLPSTADSASVSFTLNVPSSTLPAATTPTTIASFSADPIQWFLSAFSSDDPEENLKRWSSFIGIVVAICGNVLISLALNIQKYAHIRLERENERQKRVWRIRQKNSRKSPRRGVSGGGENGRSLSGMNGNAHQNGYAQEDADLEELRIRVRAQLREHSSDFVEFPPSPPPDEHSTLLPSEKDLRPTTDQKYLHSPYWWTGLVLMFFGECGNFLAYGFAPASIVSPLGVVALISNCVIAPVMLKEPFRGRDLVGVLVSIAGAVTVVWSAEKEETKFGPDEILEAISQTPFEVYFGVTLAMIVGLMYLSSRYGQRLIIIDLGLVALFGGYTVLSTKGISSLISSSFYHIFAYPIAYLFSFVLITTAILQIKYVNRALQRFDSTQVIPTQFVLFTISVIVGSAILYRDFETMGRDHLVKFVFGCSLTFWGVYLITTERKGRKALVEDDEIGLEEGSLIDDETDDEDESPRPQGENRPDWRLTVPIEEDVPTTSSSPGYIARETTRTPQHIPSREIHSLRPGMGSRGMSSSSTAVLTDTSIAGSPASSPPKQVSTSPPVPPGIQTPRSTPHIGPSHRRSMSLLPGPIVAGYQLQGVIADHVSGSLQDLRDKGKKMGIQKSRSGKLENSPATSGNSRSRAGSLAKRGLVLEREPEEPQRDEQEEAKAGKRKKSRSQSLSLVLEFVKGKRKGGRTEEGEGSGR